MVGIGGVLEVLLVTAVAGRVGDGVIVVDVTIGELPRGHGVHARERKSGAVVVKRRVHPVAGVVALLASLGETGGDVVGIARALEIFQVTGHARRAVERVVIADVTIGALPGGHGVHARQSKAGDGVIKRGVGPLHGVVTLFAGGGKAGVWHRRGRAVEILLMASNAR